MTTNQEKLQYIKSKVVEVCPEVMELSFGCRIEGNKNHPILLYVGKSNGQYCLLIQENQELLFVDRLGKEVLGHPITLSHILRTIGKGKTKGLLSPNIQNIVEFWEARKVLEYWDFSKENLADQHPETINLVYEILNW